MPKITFGSSLKKFKKLDGYSCNAHSPSAALYHVFMKFRNTKNNHLYSQYELDKARAQNKIILYVDFQ